MSRCLLGFFYWGKKQQIHRSFFLKKGQSKENAIRKASLALKSMGFDLGNVGT
jgi:hypothetical protein